MTNLKRGKSYGPEIMEPVVVQVSMEETDVTSERSSVSIRRLRGKLVKI